MQRKRRPGYSYSVYIGSYASEEVKSMVERNEEDFTHPEHFAAQLFYSGSSKALADAAFGRAALAAMNNPLAFEVVMTRDSHTIIRVKAERF